jgi:hypothetical protein
MDNLPQLANDPERFAWIRQHLYMPAVCDILDSLGYRDQAMPTATPSRSSQLHNRWPRAISSLDGDGLRGPE